MFTFLFWLALIAAIALAFRSYKQWEGYHRGQVQRVPLVNGIVTTAVVAAVAVLLLFLGALR